MDGAMVSTVPSQQEGAVSVKGYWFLYPISPAWGLRLVQDVPCLLTKGSWAKLQPPQTPVKRAVVDGEWMDV